MTSNAWHVDDELWAAYAAGRLDMIAQSSLESHVAGCARCRTSARGQVAVEELEPMWSGISLEVRRPQPRRALRWLRRLGVSDENVTLLAASDGLPMAWSAAVGAALACGVMAGLTPSYQDFLFLLLAPLIPMLAVVAVYDATSSLHEVAAGTPYSKLRLVLLRTTAALVVALPATLAVGLLIPGLANLAFLGLLPGLAMSLSALLLIGWLTPWSAAGVVGGAWAIGCAVLQRSDDVTVLAGAGAQAAFAGAIAVVAVLLILRTTTLSARGGLS
jgi:hypothetical protein